MDIDGDGLADLVGMLGLGYLAVRAPGLLGGTRSIDTSCRYYANVAGGDFDTDGYDDVACQSDEAIVTYAGGREGLAEGGSFALEATSADTSPRALGDVDGDGFADIAVWSNSLLSVYAGSPHGLDAVLDERHADDVLSLDPLGLPGAGYLVSPLELDESGAVPVYAVTGRWEVAAGESDAEWSYGLAGLADLDADARLDLVVATESGFVVHRGAYTPACGCATTHEGSVGALLGLMLALRRVPAARAGRTRARRTSLPLGR